MILAAHMVMLTAPVLVHAEGNHNFINFTEPLKTERGELAPIGPDASYLSDADACAIATREWGWASCTTLDKIAVDIGPGVGTILLRKPVSDGYVKLDDFVGNSARAEIDQIARDLKESLAAQSKQTGTKIEFTGWRLYPTADRQRNLIYYALDMSWDGDPQTAIRVMLLDRYGFIEMEVLPSADNLGARADRCRHRHRNLGLQAESPGVVLQLPVGRQGCCLWRAGRARHRARRQIRQGRVGWTYRSRPNLVEKGVVHRAPAVRCTWGSLQAAIRPQGRRLIERRDRLPNWNLFPKRSTSLLDASHIWSAPV